MDGWRMRPGRLSARLGTAGRRTTCLPPLKNSLGLCQKAGSIFSRLNCFSFWPGYSPGYCWRVVLQQCRQRTFGLHSGLVCVPRTKHAGSGGRSAYMWWKRFHSRIRCPYSLLTETLVCGCVVPAWMLLQMWTVYKCVSFEIVYTR